MAFYDLSGTKVTEEDLTRVPISLPTMSDSMKEELSKRGIWDKATAGLGTAASNLKMGLNILPPGPIGAARRAIAGQPIVNALSPKDLEQIGFNNQITDTTPGRIGNIAGNIAMSYPAFGLVNSAAATMPTAGARLATNIAGSGGVGALYGGASNPGNQAEGATLGGLGGVIGASFGELAQGPLRPGYNSTAAALQDQGVRLTPGASGGGVFKGAEDAVRTINPSVVDRQNEMIGDFNKVELNRVLKEGVAQPLPANVKAGWDANQAAGKSFGAEYQAKGAVPIQADQQFLSDVKGIDKSGIPATQLPALRAQIQAVKDTLSNPVSTTDAVRKLENDLSAAATSAKSGQNPSSALANAYTQLKDALSALRDRAGVSTPDLDKAYAQFARMRDAAASPASKDTGLFTPNQVIRQSVNNTSDPQVAYGNALLQRPYAQLAPVLGDTIPRIGPGTFEKGALLGGGTAAAHALLSGDPGLAATAVGLYGLNKLAYTPSGVSFLTGAKPWQSIYGPTIGALAPASAVQFLRKR